MESLMSAKNKPIVFSDDRGDAEKYDPNLHAGSLDPSRVPGYAEIVKANDIAQADPLIFRDKTGMTQEELYAQIGAKPQELPVELAWLRICGPGGAESHSAARELDSAVNQQGFRLATKDDLDNYGYGFPPAARMAEDGTIRRGPDVALYIRSGEVARKWEQYYAAETARLEGTNALPETLREGDHSVETFSEAERKTVEVTH
jgi:hypothetical protein